MVTFSIGLIILGSRIKVLILLREFSVLENCLKIRIDYKIFYNIFINFSEYLSFNFLRKYEIILKKEFVLFL